jgi:eukaryotic-like serine/threonine-protein kinase
MSAERRPDEQPASTPSGRAGATPAVGDRIAGKYVVERVLGAGGMGVVLAARHEQLGLRVAIKLIRGEVTEDPSAVSRFLREARASAALSSEHVTRVFDTGTLDSGGPYMVMEYLAGTDLAEVLKRSGPIAIGDALTTVLQACEAIAEAHVKGIVHRDLKPSNLFLARRANGAPLIKVLDFGISKVVDFNAPGLREVLTGSGSILGSPYYMSPEQVRSTKSADGRMDIWSLGVILYELLAGVTPFAGDTLGDTFARILGEAPAPLCQRRPDVPEGLAAVIAQCLERDVERRIQNVADLAVKLAPYAPAEASASIDSILLIQRPPGGGTLAASSTLAESAAVSGPASFAPYESGREEPTPHAARSDTRPAWQRSNAKDGASRGAAGRGLAVVALGLGVAAATAGLYAFVGQTPAGSPAPSNASDRSPPSPALGAPRAMASLVPTATASPVDLAPSATNPIAVGSAASAIPHVAAPATPPANSKGNQGRTREIVPPRPRAQPTVARPTSSTPPPAVTSDKDIF